MISPDEILGKVNGKFNPEIFDKLLQIHEAILEKDNWQTGLEISITNLNENNKNYMLSKLKEAGWKVFISNDKFIIEIP